MRLAARHLGCQFAWKQVVVKVMTRPSLVQDILVSNPSGSASAVYDVTVTSPLNPSIISEAGVSAGTAAKAAEVRKHSKYDVKCSELGWVALHSLSRGNVRSMGS